MVLGRKLPLLQHITLLKDEECILVGTFFKKMQLKFRILNEYLENVSRQPPHVCFRSCSRPLSLIFLRVVTGVSEQLLRIVKRIIV